MELEIPYNFSWFVEGKIAGMGWPDEETMEYLAKSGIKALINLSCSDSFYQTEAKKVGIKCHNVPIEDLCPPTTKQIKKVIQLIKEVTEDGAIGIHCYQGCGRTGTMLACYLVAVEGYTADNAITETRKRRRYSIETSRQERAVREFEEHLRSKKK